MVGVFLGFRLFVMTSIFKIYYLLLTCALLKALSTGTCYDGMNFFGSVVLNISKSSRYLVYGCN